MKYSDTLLFGANGVLAEDASSRDFYSIYGKRAFDIVFALALLPFVFPIIAALWLVVRRDGGPGIFGHTRVGRDGIPFQCWKIRSMVNDADGRLAALLASNADARAEWELSQKLVNDPRVTRFGAFIRRTSLDELPQIINVLRGDMSFVGPRPVIEDELKRYGPLKAMYLSMRPGITGLWQVSGRNSVSYAERVAFDVAYKQRLSFTTDCQLLLLTVRVVLSPTGL